MLYLTKYEKIIAQEKKETSKDEYFPTHGGVNQKNTYRHLFLLELQNRVIFQ